MNVFVIFVALLLCVFGCLGFHRSDAQNLRTLRDALSIPQRPLRLCGDI
jgi:hypothetical protein